MKSLVHMLQVNYEVLMQAGKELARWKLRTA